MNHDGELATSNRDSVIKYRLLWTEEQLDRIFVGGRISLFLHKNGDLYGLYFVYNRLKFPEMFPFFFGGVGYKGFSQLRQEKSTEQSNVIGNWLLVPQKLKSFQEKVSFISCGDYACLLLTENGFYLFFSYLLFHLCSTFTQKRKHLWFENGSTFFLEFLVSFLKLKDLGQTFLDSCQNHTMKFHTLKDPF